MLLNGLNIKYLLSHFGVKIISFKELKMCIGKVASLHKPNKPLEGWARVEAMTDDEIDISDIPPLDAAFFANARLRMPEKVSVTLNVNADVSDAYRRIKRQA